MRQLSFIALAVSLILLVGGAVAVYAYDAARDDLIAHGVTAGGVDVGGMRASEARAALTERLALPLERPVTIAYRSRRFRLSAARAGVRTDIEGMVQEALAASRDGNLVTRAARDLTGRRLYARVPVRVTYSTRAIRGLARRLERVIDRPARDARLRYSATGLRRVRSKNGLAVRAAELQDEIESEIVDPAADRVVVARTRLVRPKVSTRELASRYPYFITVDRKGFRLRLFRRLKLVRSYRVAIGRAGYDTPTGLYRIQNKAINAAWHVPKKPWAGKLAGKIIPGGAPNNPLKARWMGIYDGAGIHGTDAVASLGRAASHGCIRMAIPDVKDLYEQVPVHTPVYIA